MNIESTTFMALERKLLWLSKRIKSSSRMLLLSLTVSFTTLMTTLHSNGNGNANGIGKCLFTNKVSVIGVGQVGMACATSIANAGIAKVIALNDVVPLKVKGEVMDMQQSLSFLRTTVPPTVVGSDDISVTADSDLIVVSCGVRQRVGESRLSLVARNIVIFETLIPVRLANTPLSLTSHPYLTPLPHTLTSHPYLPTPSSL